MVEYIDREELMKFPIRRNHYDKEHGNEHFIFGIEAVMEYAENLPAADVVPVSELEKLRDTLYENDWIFFNGLSELNKLIERYKRNNEVSE